MDLNETGCQSAPSAPESPMPCVNNCGFFGNAATMNMCSKCHRAESSIASIGKCWVDPTLSEPIILEGVCAFRMANCLNLNKTSEEKEEEKAVEGPKRCSTCRKRIGLLGFKCRCGNFFCGVHRYTDKHECVYDYRNTAQDSISKANPVVKAEKLNKI